MKLKLMRLLLLLLIFNNCDAQNDKQKMNTENNNKNPLLCDIETGVCETSEEQAKLSVEQAAKNTDLVKIIYFTDPICSSCWGIEPQLRKLKLEYGNNIQIEYRMGGLLPDWNYNSGGISQPSDVAHHWDEVSIHYDMPIDGDVWLEDPLDSSYPPSIAYKAAQMQSDAKAELFMRTIREMVFLKKINIAKRENLEKAAIQVGLDIEQFRKDLDNEAKIAFQEDLKLGKEYGVRGFPTMFFIDKSGKKEMVYGSKPYAFYEMGVLKADASIEKKEYRKDWETLFAKYNSLTAKEFSVLSGMPRTDCEVFLDKLVASNHLEKLSTKNGALWTKR